MVGNSKRAIYLGRDTRLEPAACLYCGVELDGATGIGHKRKPRPGAITICMKCGHIQAFAWDLTFRELTNSEMCEMAGDERILAIQRARKGVMPRDRT